MATQVLAEILERSAAERGDLLVMIVLGDQAGKETRVAHCGLELIMRYTKLSERAVRYALRKLERMGEIAILAGTGRGLWNAYRVNPLPDLERGQLLPPLSIEKGATIAPFCHEKGGNGTQKRGQLATDTLFRMSLKTYKAPARRFYEAEFSKTIAIYPKRLGSDPGRQAYQQWQARIKQGDAIGDIHAGVERYARWCEKRGLINTEYVMQAKRFFGAEKEFLKPWGQPPPKTENRNPVPKPDAIDQESKRRADIDRFNKRMIELGHPEQVLPSDAPGTPKETTQ